MNKMFLFLAVTFTLGGFLSAQTVDKKLKDLKGDVKKITITTDSGSVTFEGVEAAKLEKRLKSKEHKSFNSFHSFDDSTDGSMPRKFKMKSGNGMMIINDDTIKIPDFSSKDFKFNCDSMMTDIRKNMKENMCCLKEQLKCLKDRVIIMDGCDDFDFGDMDCDKPDCDSLKSESKSEHHGDKKIKKKIIIKKHMNDDDKSDMKKEKKEKEEIY